MAFCGESGSKYNERLGLREGYKPFCSVALGYCSGDVPETAPRKDVITYIK
jgi:hypothetical protein